MFISLAAVVLGFVALVNGQDPVVIESRSSVVRPDGSTEHSTQRGYSHATYSEESTGPDGTTRGKTVHRDSTGKTYGNEWTGKDGKIDMRQVDGADAAIPSGIGGRTSLPGLGGLGAPGIGSGFGNPGYGSTIGSGFPTAGSGFPSAGSGFPGAGSGIGSGFPGSGSGFPSAGSRVGSGFPGSGSGVGGGFGNPGLNSGFGQSGFPGSGAIPWSSFGDFQGYQPKMPEFDFSKFGFMKPPQIPNYSKFLLGGVGFNPNLPNSGSFGNIRFGYGNGGFGGVGSGYPGSTGFGSGTIDPGFAGSRGGPQFGQRSYKHEVDPASGKQTYSYSESTGHSSSSGSHV